MCRIAINYCRYTLEEPGTDHSIITLLQSQFIKLESVTKIDVLILLIGRKGEGDEGDEDVDEEKNKSGL